MSNVSTTLTDVQVAFRKAAAIFEDRFRTEMQSLQVSRGGYGPTTAIEPEAMDLLVAGANAVSLLRFVVPEPKPPSRAFDRSITLGLARIESPSTLGDGPVVCVYKYHVGRSATPTVLMHFDPTEPPMTLDAWGTYMREQAAQLLPTMG